MWDITESALSIKADFIDLFFSQKATTFDDGWSDVSKEAVCWLTLELNKIIDTESLLT